MLGPSNYVNYSRRNPKRSAKYVYLTGTFFYCTCGHFLHKERGANQQFINCTMNLLSVPEYVIKKGRPHGHRYGKKPGDKKYHTASQLKNKCKKKFFQGIHDRFIRDPEFRNRMIENNRDEELCRTWDALADNDHTHHYSLYKSNWWLHSNKQGSNTVPLTHRSDFKKALSPLQQLKQKEEGALQTPTNSERNQQWAQTSSSWWNWQGSWWTPYSYESHDGDETKYWQNGATWHDFLEFNYFVTDGSFTADIGVL